MASSSVSRRPLNFRRLAAYVIHGKVSSRGIGIGPLIERYRECLASARMSEKSPGCFDQSAQLT